MRKPKPLVEIAGTGRFLPDNIVTNDDLAQRLDTTDEWIRSRTGIRERRIAPDDMGAADLGAGAAMKAMKSAGVEPGEIDILIVATATPDRWLPSTACEMQAKLGCSNAVAFDIMAACSGFIYGLTVAEGYLAAGRGEVALVVSAEKMSTIVDWEDRSTCVLFGDGGGAAVVRPANGSGRGILSSHLRSDGNLGELLSRPAGGALIPMSHPPGSHEGARGLQARGTKHGGCVPARPSDRGPDSRRCRPARPASGEYENHRVDRETRGSPDGASLRQCRPVREHELRHGPGRDRRGGREGTDRTGLQCPARRVWRRPHVGRDGAPLVTERDRACHSH